ncbi:MAG: DUF885 domain-containing protein [Anaerolineae bacterium]
MNSISKSFQQLADRYLTGLFDFWPCQASFLGLHEYDARQPDLSASAIAGRLDMVRSQAGALAALNPAQLTAEEAFDYRLLEAALELELYQWEAERGFRLNPMWYLRAIEFSNFLVRNYEPLQERLRGVIGYLRNTPAILTAARENLAPHLARPLIEVSLQMYKGLRAFYDTDLQAVASLADGSVLDELQAARQTASQAVDQFIQALEGQYLPAANEDYAIGVENYRRMLHAGELVDLPIETLLKIGERDLARNLAGAREQGRQIDPTLSLQEVAQLLQCDHPSKAELIPATRDLLEAIRQFLIDRHIVSVPSEVRAQVEETPTYMRWAFAMMDTPGPFETVGTEAYFYVTPPDPNWSAEQQEEWLGSFNHSFLQNLVVHEAYPGHYIQYLHVNYRLHSRLRQALILVLSYAFSEGWAHYAEEMMLDAGLGDQNPRLRFAQFQDALVRNCRYICSIRMHTQGMSVDEATRFFMENALMGETPSRQEALRGTFDPGYLYYTLGKLMIVKLRDDLKKREGTDFDLHAFHDRLLSYGTPPLPLLRAEMLGADSGEIL